MWVFTELGFFSAVRYNEARDPQSKRKGKLAKGEPVKVMVRARVYDDLQNLVELYDGLLEKGDSILPPEAEPLEILEWQYRDYPYRVIMHRDVWTRLLAAISDGITYTNFKDHIKKKQGYERSSMYGSVWSVMYDAERKLDPEAPKSIYSGGRDDEDVWAFFDRQATVTKSSQVKTSTGGKKRSPARKHKTKKQKMLDDALANGFDQSHIDSAGVKIKCSQCAALVINGVGTHEAGCPRSTGSSTGWP